MGNSRINRQAGLNKASLPDISLQSKHSGPALPSHPIATAVQP